MTGSNGAVVSGFKIKENVLIVEKARAERLHRLIVDVVIGGVKGRFIREFSTLSGINVDFSITPLSGDTSVVYSFNVNRLTNTLAQFEYVWEYQTGDKRGVIGQTVEDNY